MVLRGHVGHIARDWIEAVMYAAVVLAVLFVFCWPFKIDGVSMSNTLRHNDRIVVSRFAVWANNLDRGDMVVCRILDDGQRAIVVKRIVGLPGDHVKISDGKIFLNGLEHNESYLYNVVTEGYIEVDLANGEYFVLGDNRALSFDSRAAGPVGRADIVGKVMARWYPFTEFTRF